jgi:hypothetical protein
MGFFSWKTSDTDKSISNAYSKRGTFKVYMITPTDRYLEQEYEGYGVFGGKDYYELVYELNKRRYHGPEDVEDRSKGIRIAFEKKNEGNLVLPKFAESEDASWLELPDSRICEQQGYFYQSII